MPSATKTKSGPSKLFSFKEQLENEVVDVPMCCMEHDPKFNDMAREEADLLDGGDDDADVTPLTIGDGTTTTQKKNANSHVHQWEGML